MATLFQSQRVTFGGLAAFLWLVPFFAAVAWFLGPSLFEARGDKWLPFALHIGGGLLVILTGPFQFIAPVRNRFRRYHRYAGYTFVAGTAASILGFAMLLPLELDIFLLSQIVALAVWALCTVFAVMAIRRKHVLTHQHNMARAFVVAVYFVTVRVIDRYLMWALEPLSSVTEARLAHSDWLAWVVPLIAVEIWFGLKWDRLLAARRKANG